MVQVILKYWGVFFNSDSPCIYFVNFLRAFLVKSSQVSLENFLKIGELEKTH